MPESLTAIMSKQPPSLVILDQTYDAEVAARERIRKVLSQIELLTVDSSALEFDERLEVALDSITFFLAEELSRKDTPLENTIHLRKEHFEEASARTVAKLESDPIGVLEEVSEWHSSVTHSLKSELSKASKREAILRTCERYKIDLTDFPTLFPKLP